MPARIQRRRVKGWRLPDNTVIVDRTSRFGNPFTIATAREMGYDDPRQAAVDAFIEWLRGNRDMWQSHEGDQLRERILTDLPTRLRGRNLACPCEPDQSCHADELLRLAAMPSAEYEAWAVKVRLRVDRHRTWRAEDPMYAEAAS